jgi:hypothetical protein
MPKGKKKAKTGKISQSKAFAGKKRKEEYPGRPKKCDNIPWERACQKTKSNEGMYCRNCTA